VSERFHLTEPRDDYREEKLRQLENFIASNEHLSAICQLLSNRHYSNEELDRVVQRWNASTPWVGGYVEKQYGPDWRRLLAMMDMAGNVRLRVLQPKNLTDANEIG